MSLTTRAATAAAVLAVAAIPVGALTLSQSSNEPVSIAVDHGADKAAQEVSRLVSENATLTVEGEALLTVAAAPHAQGLVPENPVTEPTEAASIATGALPEAKAETEAETPKRTSPRRRAQAQKKGGPSAGSFEMLFSGPAKK